MSLLRLSAMVVRRSIRSVSRDARRVHRPGVQEIEDGEFEAIETTPVKERTRLDKRPQDQG